MRKLIFIGIISVLIVVAWISYLMYDIKQFREEFPLVPTKPPKQQVNRHAKDALETSADDAAETIHAEEDKMTFLTQEMPEDVPQPYQNEANTETEMATRELQQTPEDIGLSPVLKELFTEFHPLHVRSFEVAMELNPITEKSIESNDRLKEIGKHLTAAAEDEVGRRKIQAERDAIYEWIEKIKPIVIKLQNESLLLTGERERLLSEYGFSSEDDFWRTHEDDYDTWLNQ